MKLIYPIFIIMLLIIASCTTQQTNIINDETSSENQVADNVNTAQPDNNVQNQGENFVEETTPAETPIQNENQVTFSELSTHNSKSDCWVAYEGKVYDVTKFLPLHPGGTDAIAKYCGSASEFEQGFTKKHGTSKVSVLLQQIYKGDLV